MKRFRNMRKQIALRIKARDTEQTIAWILYSCYWLVIIATILTKGFHIGFLPVPMGLFEIITQAFDRGVITRIYVISVLRLRDLLFNWYIAAQMFSSSRSGGLFSRTCSLVYLLLDFAAIIGLFIMNVAMPLWNLVLIDLLLIAYNVATLTLHLREKKKRQTEKSDQRS